MISTCYKELDLKPRSLIGDPMTTGLSTVISTDVGGLPQNSVKFLWLELTRQCNLECTHCYEESSPRQPLLGSMTVQDWKRALDQAANISTTDVQFVGGEPTLYPHLEELIAYADELGMCSEVYTNGIKITPVMWTMFQRYNVALAFSYYSKIEAEHDAITGRRGSHARTRAAIIRAQSLKLKMRVGVIQMPSMSNEGINMTVQELHELGIEQVGVDRMRGIGRGVVDFEVKRNPFKELCGSCGDNKLAIDNNGNVHPCIMSKFMKLGHISAGLHSMINGSRLSQFREDLLEAHPERTMDECIPDSGGPPCSPACCPNTVGDCSP